MSGHPALATLSASTGRISTQRPERDATQVTQFAEVVAAHLERFGDREELTVVWHQRSSA